MDSWYDIVKSYDDPKSKDHGTLSQKTASILLIYLSFGTDYSGGIAKFFNELSARWKDCPNILTNSNKISSVLKRMAQDELIILSKEATVKAGTRKYYVINPQILQSPIKDSKTYTKRDGSPFIIPLEIIEDFLEWLAMEHAGSIDKEHQKKLDEQRRSARHERTDDIFEKIFLKASLTYISFLDMIYSNAALRDLLWQSKNKRPILDSLT
jgi:hypothetical protein